MNESINILNGRAYKIPNDLDDSKNIEYFLEKNSHKKVVVVQGLGFVGAVMSLVCANSLDKEYAVIGVDLPNKDNFWKIQSINEGQFPLVAEDPQIDYFFKNSMEKGNFFATYDPIAYSFADVIIVDVNLDVSKTSNADFSLNSFDVDLTNFKKAISSIGENCKEDSLILVETTVPPGTCINVVKPIIDSALEERNLSSKKYKLSHSYERVMPGPEYINSIRSYPRVYSGVDSKSADAAEKFLKTIIDTDKCTLSRLEHTNATEIAKVLENSYRAMNIAFAVEWSRFAEEAGVDLFSIVNAIRERNTHANLMYPGIGVGGYCLTKDPLLASWARKNFFGTNDDLEMSVESVSTNDQMPFFAFQRLKEIIRNIGEKKITLLGVSYRGDVGDTRFSPVEPFYNLLLAEGAEIKTHDPYITFWEEANLNISSELDDSLDGDPEIIIISTGHSLYKSQKTINMLCSLKPAFIFDTIGIFDDNQMKVLKQKHVVSILGNGEN
jgi:UDP-N-acetyl-D-glucosamine dehydrogenase